MFKYIRNNQKTVMAFVGVILMIAFALQGNSQSGRSETDRPFATIYGGKTKITYKEHQRLINEWRLLKSRIEPRVLASALGGENIFIAIDNNEEIYPLLVHEAQDMKVVADRDSVESVLVNVLNISKDTHPDEYQAVRPVVANFMSVLSAAKRVGDVVKISEPEVLNTMAATAQQLSLNVIEFRAAEFLDKVEAPTPQQIEEQFKKYKDVLAETSPTGFGYKYPNRVKYDAVIIKRDEVKKGITPVEMVDVAEYYLRNKGSNDLSTTKATSSPADSFTLGSGPTTRPMTLEEAKDKILLKLTTQRAEELTDKVRDAVRNILTADYKNYAAAIAAKTPAPNSSLGLPYDSKDYLPRLRDKIQSDFKVTLTIEREDGWQTTASLKDKPIGKASVFAGRSFLTFDRYAGGLVEPFLSDDDRKMLAGQEVKSVKILEPTTTFRSENMDESIIVRFTEAQATHSPANVDEVKDKVIADVKTAAAFESAKKAAQTALDAAKAGKWLQSVANERNRKMVNTGTFSAQTFQRNGRSIEPLQLKDAPAETFYRAAYALLSTPPREGSATRPTSTQPTTASTTQASTQASTQATAPISSAFKEHPVGLIELPAEGRVFVAEIDQLKPLWTQATQDRETREFAQQQKYMVENALRQLWFSFDNVVTRLDYKPEEKRGGNKTPSQNMPNNPLGL